MTERSHKFAFDTVFSADGEVLRDGERVKRILTVEEAEAMREAGFQDGQASETARAAQAEADALRAIAAQMQLIIARLHSESETLKQDAANLAIAAANKIAGQAIDGFGAETISQLATEVMADLRSEPRFSVLCPPALASSLSVKLDEVATRTGFEGRVIVRGEEGMSGADCRLEWSQGSISRTAEDIESRLKELVSRWLMVGAEDDETGTGERAHSDPAGADLPDDNANVA
tara:strand:+ start:713 stop:1408 length:696 start_codon:yes stop_codon:yes gene_type:complete